MTMLHGRLASIPSPGLQSPSPHIHTQLVLGLNQWTIAGDQTPDCVICPFSVNSAEERRLGWPKYEHWNKQYWLNVSCGWQDDQIKVNTDKNLWLSGKDNGLKSFSSLIFFEYLIVSVIKCCWQCWQWLIRVKNKHVEVKGHKLFSTF